MVQIERNDQVARLAAVTILSMADRQYRCSCIVALLQQVRTPQRRPRVESRYPVDLGERPQNDDVHVLVAGRVENLRTLYVKEVQSISAGSPAPILLGGHLKAANEGHLKTGQRI
jgi:hypothetical protein